MSIFGDGNRQYRKLAGQIAGTVLMCDLGGVEQKMGDGTGNIVH